MRIIFLLYIFLFAPFNVCGQLSVNNTININFQSFALLNVSPTGNIILTFFPPSEAGKAIGYPVVNDTKYLKYTSSIAAGGMNRRITASINQLIPGVALKLNATSSTTGGGLRGTPTSTITLSTSPQNIITNIGGAYTGIGALGTDGHKLTLSADFSSYGDLRLMVNRTVTITYTITE